MEVKLFLYDKNCNPFFFRKLFEMKKFLSYEPAFVLGTFYDNAYNKFLYADSKREGRKVTFGTVYYLDIDEYQWEIIKASYTVSGAMSVKEVEVTPIRFTSMYNLVNNKFFAYPKEKFTAMTFALDVSKEENRRFLSNRHNVVSLSKYFLSAY